MNKIYKTVWNAVRQQFVVADEAQNTRGKPAKAAVALTVVAAALCSTMASAAYVEPGFVANSRLQMDEAKASWETDEYMKNWGLVAQKASAAYALGFHGQGVKVGMMDSGFLKITLNCPVTAGMPCLPTVHTTITESAILSMPTAKNPRIRASSQLVPLSPLTVITIQALMTITVQVAWA